jgi:hypothetical protein
MTLLDKVAHYSCEPKVILSGQPANDNEILASELPATDLEYLMQWVKAGGETAAMLAMFPQRSPENALASRSRRTVRAKAKSVSGS